MILRLLSLLINVGFASLRSGLVKLSSLELYVNIFLEFVLEHFLVFYHFRLYFHSAFWHGWYFFQMKLLWSSIDFNDLSMMAINELFSTDKLDKFALGDRIRRGLKLDTFEKLLLFFNFILLLFFLQSKLLNKVRITVILFHGAHDRKEPFLIVIGFCVKFSFRTFCTFHKTLDS